MATLPGSISGRILLEIKDPILRVFAREVNTGQVYPVQPEAGSLSYAVLDLPPGTYVVVGWFHPMVQVEPTLRSIPSLPKREISSGPVRRQW